MSTAQRVHDSFSAQGLMSTMGARLVHVAEGEVHIALPFNAALSQQRGFMHAGAIISVADSACGYAATGQVLANIDGSQKVVALMQATIMRVKVDV